MTNEATIPPNGEVSGGTYRRTALPRNLAQLQKVVWEYSMGRRGDPDRYVKKGMGSVNGYRPDAVPYSIIRELWMGTCEGMVLAHRAYAAARENGREVDPYHEDFAKRFRSYVRTLNDVLARTPFPLQITDRPTLAGYTEYTLTRTDLVDGGIQIHLPFDD